jgi:NAD(P)-dependent dehydrogenase (short-subunit alcohol dehydrogenase family)
MSVADLFSLDGKTALVTGASRGIGETIAVAYAEAGADLVLAARSADALEAVAERVRAAGRRALSVTCDVTKPEEITACVERALDEFDGIDVLVNNAGGPLFNAPFLETREEGWLRLIDLNLTSAVRFLRAVGAHMVERRRGSIISICTPGVARPWPAITGYAAAKAALVNLTQALAQEWGAEGVRVNAMSPGWIDTAINRAFVDNDEARTEIEASVPLGRWGVPADVVGTAIWLASDASSYVTGAHIPVDGGLTVGVPEDWRALRVERTWMRGD